MPPGTDDVRPDPTGPPDLAIVFPAAGVRGGVERVALDLLRFESRRRAACFVGERFDAPEDPDLRHVSVRPSRAPVAFRPFVFRRRASSVLRKVDASTTVSLGVDCPPGDVYWVHSVHAAWLAKGGDLYWRARRLPTWVRRLLLRHQVLLRLELDYFTRHRPRAILCTSTREIDDVVRLYGVPRERVHLAPPGYDSRLFSPERRAGLRQQARANIGAAAEDIVVLLVANEWHRKGLGVLLQAIAAAGDPRLQLHLVGLRPPTQYEALAAGLGLRERMHWHGSADDVTPFYAAADVFALPTTYEPFGLVIVEAMAMGLPVVTSRLAGAAAAIEPGVNGLLLDDPGDVGALRAALDVLTDPATRQRLGSAAAIAVAEYELDSVLARVDAVLFPSM